MDRQTNEDILPWSKRDRMRMVDATRREAQDKRRTAPVDSLLVEWSSTWAFSAAGEQHLLPPSSCMFLSYQLKCHTARGWKTSCLL